MDLTKALDEMKRVKDFLSAVQISEETMKVVGSLSDEVAALKRDREALAGSISQLKVDYIKASASHSDAMKKIDAEMKEAQEALVNVKRDTNLARKAFGTEAEALSVSHADMRKDNNQILAKIREEVAIEQAKLKELRATIGKITGLAG